MRISSKIGIWLALLLLVVIFSLPAVQASRAMSRMTSSQNNLKRIGVGLSNYNDVYSMLPLGADAGADGQPRNGWQVRLLPFLEGGVFIPIDFNYAWNDPFNAPYFKLRAPVWLVPGVKRVTDENGFALSHYAGNSHLFGIDYGASLGKIPAGGANTILAGEVAGGFSPWGRPANWRDPVRGLTGDQSSFGSDHPAGVQFVMCDGSVRIIERHIDPSVLRALATPAEIERESDD
ncbi:MAG: DUF1559 domain-containing protein [Pirellulales bacterium]